MSTLTTVLCGALCGISVTSCSNHDFDMEEELAKNPEYVYQTNFEKLVGTIAPDQSWDFSSTGMGQKHFTRGAADGTLGTITPSPAETWYNVEQGTLDYFKAELAEGTNNRSKGSNFLLTAPNNSFTITPLYQGGAAYKWDLHMVVEFGGETQDVLIWQKHRDIQLQLDDDIKSRMSEEDDPHNTGGFPVDGDWYDTKHGFQWHPITTPGEAWEGWQNYEYGYNTLGASAIRSKTISFGDAIPEGASIYFYLDVKREKDGDWVDVKKQSSLNGMMVYLTGCPRPSNTTVGAEVMIIGCEDNHEGDWDMNDLVFMITGNPFVPVPSPVIEEKFKKVDVSKRYMVEDLGTTDDIDFNDVVVDIERYHEEKMTFDENGVLIKTERVANSEGQRAIFRAMGGTLNFRFYIDRETMSDTEANDHPIFEKSAWLNYKHMYNTETTYKPYDVTYTIEDTNFKMDASGNVTSGWKWNPQTNNVFFKVISKADNLSSKTSGNVNSIIVNKDGTYTIQFPSTGTVPFIIAFDTYKKWRDERHLICDDWLNNKEGALESCADED